MKIFKCLWKLKGYPKCLFYCRFSPRTVLLALPRTNFGLHPSPTHLGLRHSTWSMHWSADADDTEGGRRQQCGAGAFGLSLRCVDARKSLLLLAYGGNRENHAWLSSARQVHLHSFCGVAVCCLPKRATENCAERPMHRITAAESLSASYASALCCRTALRLTLCAVLHIVMNAVDVANWQKSKTDGTSINQNKKIIWGMAFFLRTEWACKFMRLPPSNFAVP